MREFDLKLLFYEKVPEDRIIEVSSNEECDKSCEEEQKTVVIKFAKTRTSSNSPKRTANKKNAYGTLR